MNEKIANSIRFGSQLYHCKSIFLNQTCFSQYLLVTLGQNVRVCATHMAHCNYKNPTYNGCLIFFSTLLPPLTIFLTLIFYFPFGFIMNDVHARRNLAVILFSRKLRKLI